MKVTSLKKHYKVNDSIAQLDTSPTNKHHLLLQRPSTF